MWRDSLQKISLRFDSDDWTMLRGRQYASWLRQMESCLKDTGMTGLAAAWAMARQAPERRLKEYRRPHTLSNQN